LERRISKDKTVAEEMKQQGSQTFGERGHFSTWALII